jgi:acyl-CoA reductase-like NAD-dependent aldehyde dehydrogenase
VSDLLHWHREGDEPSECREPAACCVAKFEAHLIDAVTAAQREVEADRVEQTRRLILSAVQRVEDHRAAIKVLISDEAERDLADRVAGHCINLIRAAACICPELDVQSFGEAEPRTVKGRDPRCGVHGEG